MSKVWKASISSVARRAIVTGDGTMAKLENCREFKIKLEDCPSMYYT